jgi:hypothetical protein
MFMNEKSHDLEDRITFQFVIMITIYDYFGESDCLVDDHSLDLSMGDKKCQLEIDEFHKSHLKTIDLWCNSLQKFEQTAGCKHKYQISYYILAGLLPYLTKYVLTFSHSQIYSSRISMFESIVRIYR